VDLGGPKEACITWGAHWHHLTNTIGPSMFGGPAKTADLIEMPFGVWTLVSQRKHVLDGSRSPHAKGQSLGKRTCLGMPDDILP